METYKICKKCVIDNIAYKYTIFDSNGVCEYCNIFEKKTKKKLELNLEISEKYNKDLKHRLTSIRKKNNLDYDCIIGVSGGVDSSYLVYHAVTVLDLKPLLYHVDVGWNNTIAVSNIESLIDKFDLDLHTDVIDWNEVKDLSRSFLFAQVPYMETVQDHAIWAGMHNFAKKNKIKNILTGGNLQTESYRAPLYIAYYAGDLTLIKDIHKKFGKIELKKYPTLDILKYKIFYKYYYNIKLHEPLNFFRYNKNHAINILKKEIGWVSYGSKHHESNYTKFFDAYWKTNKFNHDPRKGQLSSLIATQQITRDEALDELSYTIYNNENIYKDFKYISDKLDLTTDELTTLFNGENKYYYNYKSKSLLLKIITSIIKFIKIENRNIK